jgi:hypothetical protein
MTLLGLGVWQARPGAQTSRAVGWALAAGPGRAGNLTTNTVTRPMGLPRHRQPHRLVGDGSLAYLARGHGVVSVRQWGGAVRTHPLPLTLASDLGKRRSAQRLALDT